MLTGLCEPRDSGVVVEYLYDESHLKK